MAALHTRPRYFKSRGGYYVCIGRKQIRLAKGKKDDPHVKRLAQEEFNRLMATRLSTGSAHTTLYALINAYLIWVQEEKMDKTFRNRKVYLKKLNEKHGKMLARDLSLVTAEQFMKSQGTWGAASRDQFISSLNACYNWALRRNLVSDNPFKSMSKPVIQSRAKNKDDLITPQIFEELLSEAQGATRDILVALNETGARPHEIFAVEAKDYNVALQTLTPNVGKNRRHEINGRPPRTIYVTSGLRPVIERLCKANPIGPIFRNNLGRKWRNDVLAAWFADARGRLGLSGNITPYGLRHAFCQRWLLAGGSIAKLAVIIDTSVRVIEQHYSHIMLSDRDFGAEIDALLGGRKDNPATKGGAIT